MTHITAERILARYGLPVRLLFVSGTAVGGSGRSQRELAVRLVERGHEVTMLVDDERPHRFVRFAYEQLADLSAKLGSRSIARPVRWLESWPGRRVRVEALDGVEHHWSPIPENAARSVIDQKRPDVVVGSSVLRLTWRKVRASCEERRIGTVLYVREVAAMNHFTVGVPPADRIVANAASLANAVAVSGYACAMVPSVIDISVTRTEPTPEVALVINPIDSHGIDLVWNLARALPSVHFVLQESWPLAPRALEALDLRCRGLPNVELRRADAPGPGLYRDSRVLLVPHRIDNRPRVIAEAQANGVPVIASDFPGLVEAVGDGGVLLDPDDSAAWIREIEALWTNQPRLEQLAARARAHAARSEIDPERVVDEFESILREAVAAAADRYNSR